MSKLLLSLCDFSGAWSAPFLRRGWAVTRVDMAYPPGRWKSSDGAVILCEDVRDFEPESQPDAVLAAPPKPSRL